MLSAKNTSPGSLCFKRQPALLAGGAHRGRGFLLPKITCFLVPIQAVYVQKLPGERMFRYGIQYFSISKPQPDILDCHGPRMGILFLLCLGGFSLFVLRATIKSG